MYKKGFIQFAPLILFTVLAGITGVIVAAVQQTNVAEIRSRADSGTTCYKAVVVGACPQGSYASGANCCLGTKETPEPDEPKDTPRPGDGGQGGGGGITCSGDGYKCANATTCVLVRGDVCGMGAYCCNKTVGRDNCTGICGAGGSSTPKPTPKPGETPAPTPATGGGGGAGGSSCPSGQWSCKGNCADAGVQNLFSSHWCNAESQWMLEAGCGGAGSTLKSEGCGSTGGTGGGDGSGPAPTPIPTQVADGSGGTSLTAPSGGTCPSSQWSCGSNCATSDVQNVFSSHWCNGQSQWMQEAGCGGSGSTPRSAGCGGTPPLGATPVPTTAGGSCGKTPNGGFACQGIGVCNQCVNGQYQLVGNTTAGCPTNCRAGASTSGSSSPQTTPRPTQGTSATADTSSAAQAPSFVPPGFADPVKSGEDAWALCKRAGGSDFECTSQAQTAYIEAEKKLPADFYLGAWQEIKGITNAQTEANRNLVNAALKSAGVTDTNQLSTTVLSKIQQSQAVIAEQLAKGYANGVTGQNLVASAQQMGSSFGTWVVRDGSFDLALRDLAQQGVISTGGAPAAQTSGSSGSTYTPPPLQNPPPDCAGAKDPACGTYATDVDANGNVCTVVRGDGRWITLGCSNGTFGNATTGLVVDTCKVGGCRSNKTGNGICDFGENDKIAPGDCKAGVAAGTGQIAESTGERSSNYRDVNIASLEANTEATKERMKFIERSKGSTLSDAALDRKIQGQINQLALTGRESDITAINAEFDNILRKAIVEDLVYRGFTPTEANRRASAMDEAALLAAYNDIEPKQQELTKSEEEAYTKLITKTDEQLVAECKEAGNTNCTVAAIKKELLADIPPGLRTGIDAARQNYVDQVLKSLHPNYQQAFDEYLKEYKKTHPGSDDADAFADFQAEQERLFDDIQKTATNLGIFDEEYIKKIQSGEHVPTVMARDFQDVTGCKVGSTICLKSVAGVINSFNNITGGATKRGNDLVNSACFGENTNTYDCIRGGVIQGAAPATVAVAIAALPALPLAGLLSGVPVVATYGTVAAGTTALGVAGTTYSLQQTGEACAPGSIATKECGFAVGNTVFSAVSTAVGVAAFEQIAAAARVTQVAQAGVQANMAKSGADLALRGADAAVDIGTGMEVAHATTQTVSGLQTANKAISLAGVGLFGAQAVDTCFGEDADQLNCAMNVAMTVASGGRFVAASLPTAQAQTAARVGQTVEYADRGLNVGQAGLACSGALSGNSAAIIDCISGIGGAGLAFGVSPGGGQRSAIDFNPNDTIESRYLQTKQELAGLYVDPTAETPVLKPGVDAAQVSALELELRQTIPEFYQYKAALELARQPIDIPVGERTLATEDVINAQRIFDAAAAKYESIQGKTPFELASDPDYIAYQKAGQQLLEAKQLMLQEQVALRNPRGTVQKVSDGIARLFGQEPAELARLRQTQEAFAEIVKTNRPGEAMYDLAKQQVFDAQIAVDALKLPVAQRATFVAKQAELQAAKAALAELEFRQKLLEISDGEGAAALAQDRVVTLERALAAIPEGASGDAARAYVNEALRVARERVAFIENANAQGSAGRARIAEQLVNQDIAAAQNRGRVVGAEVIAIAQTGAQRNILARIGDAFRVGPAPRAPDGRGGLGARIADAYSGLLDRIPALKEWRIQQLTTIEARRAITEGTQSLGRRIADGFAGIFLGRLSEGATLSVPNHDLYSQVRRTSDVVSLGLESQAITADEVRGIIDANTPAAGAKLPEQRVLADGATLESVRQNLETKETAFQTASDAYKTAAEAYKTNQSPENKTTFESADTAFKQAQIDVFKAKKQELILTAAEAAKDSTRKAQILATTEVEFDFSSLPESKRLAAELRIRALDSRINETWKATGKLAETGVFSWKEAQIRDAFGLMSEDRSLAVQPTGGGKTFTNALFMDLSYELQGKVGTYIAKDAQSPQVYAQLKTLFGDDLYYFRLGKDASGAPIDIIAQEAQMRGAKFILAEPSDVSFLIDTMKSPGVTDQQMRSAYDVYKKLAQSNRTIDEFPEFLNARNEWVMSFAGESSVKASSTDQAIMQALRDGFVEIGVLKEGAVGSQDRVSLAGVIDKTIVAPDGSILKQAKFTAEGAAKLVDTLIGKELVVDGKIAVDASGKSVKLFDGLTGTKAEQVAKVMDVFDAIGTRDATRLAAIEGDPVLKQIYTEAILITDAMNKSASILSSEIGSETFQNGIGSKGNIQESVKDGDIVTALSRKMLQSWVYGEAAPKFGDVTVNGQTIKTNIFDLYSWDIAYRNVTGGSGGFGGVTATPDMLRDLAQMAGYRIDPTQIDAINAANRQRILGGVDAQGQLTGEGGRVTKDNFISLGENGNLAASIKKYAELLPTRLKTAANTGNKHIFASNAVGGKEEVLGRFRDEPNLGKNFNYVVGAEDGKIYEVRWRGDTPEFVPADAKYANKNLSTKPTALERILGTGIGDNTIVVILEGQSIGGDFPANGDVSFMSVIDASRANIETFYQLQGRGKRTADTLIFDGTIAFGSGDGGGNSVTALNEFFAKVSDNAVTGRKNLVAEAIPRWLSAEANAPLYESYVRAMEAGNVTDARTIGQMLADIQITSRGYDTNLNKTGAEFTKSLSEQATALSKKYQEMLVDPKYEAFFNRPENAGLREAIAKDNAIGDVDITLSDSGGDMSALALSGRGGLRGAVDNILKNLTFDHVPKYIAGDSPTLAMSRSMEDAVRGVRGDPIPAVDPESAALRASREQAEAGTVGGTVDVVGAEAQVAAAEVVSGRVLAGGTLAAPERVTLLTGIRAAAVAPAVQLQIGGTSLSVNPNQKVRIEIRIPDASPRQKTFTVENAQQVQNEINTFATTVTGALGSSVKTNQVRVTVTDGETNDQVDQITISEGITTDEVNQMRAQALEDVLRNAHRADIAKRLSDQWTPVTVEDGMPMIVVIGSLELAIARNLALDVTEYEKAIDAAIDTYKADHPSLSQDVKDRSAADIRAAVSGELLADLGVKAPPGSAGGIGVNLSGVRNALSGIGASIARRDFGGALRNAGTGVVALGRRIFEGIKLSPPAPFKKLTQEQIVEKANKLVWRRGGILFPNRGGILGIFGIKGLGYFDILNATPKNNPRVWFVTRPILAIFNAFIGNPFTWYDALRISLSEGGWQMYWAKHAPAAPTVEDARAAAEKNIIEEIKKILDENPEYTKDSVPEDLLVSLMVSVVPIYDINIQTPEGREDARAKAIELYQKAWEEIGTPADSEPEADTKETWDAYMETDLIDETTQRDFLVSEIQKLLDKNKSPFDITVEFRDTWAVDVFGETPTEQQKSVTAREIALIVDEVVKARSLRVESIIPEAIQNVELPVEPPTQVSEGTDPCGGRAFRLISQVFAQEGVGCVPVKMGEPFTVERVTYNIPAEGWVQYAGSSGRLLPPRKFSKDKPLQSVPLNTQVTIWAASFGAAKPENAENLVEFTVFATDIPLQLTLNGTPIEVIRPDTADTNGDRNLIPANLDNLQGRVTIKQTTNDREPVSGVSEIFTYLTTKYSVTPNSFVTVQTNKGPKTYYVTAIGLTDVVPGEIITYEGVQYELARDGRALTLKKYTAPVQAVKPAAKGNIFERIRVWGEQLVDRINWMIFNRTLLNSATEMVPRELQTKLLGAVRQGKKTFDVETYRMGSMFVGAKLPGNDRLIQTLISSGKSEAAAFADFASLQKSLSQALMGEMDIYYMSNGGFEHPTFWDFHADRAETIRAMVEFTKPSGTAAKIIALALFGNQARANEINVWEYLWMDLGGDPTAPLQFLIHENGAIGQQAPGATEIMAGANAATRAIDLLANPEIQAGLAARKLSPVMLQGEDVLDGEVKQTITIANKGVHYDIAVASSIRTNLAPPAVEVPQVPLSDDGKVTLLDYAFDTFLPVKTLLKLMTPEQRRNLGKSLIEVKLGRQKALPVSVDFNGIAVAEIDIAGLSKMTQIIAEMNVDDPVALARYQRLLQQLMELWQRNVTEILGTELGMAVGQYRGDAITAFSYPGGKFVDETTRARGYMRVARSFDEALRVFGDQFSDSVMKRDADLLVTIIQNQFKAGDRVIVKGGARTADVTLLVMPGKGGISVVADIQMTGVTTADLMESVKKSLQTNTDVVRFAVARDEYPDAQHAAFEAENFSLVTDDHGTFLEEKTAPTEAPRPPPVELSNEPTQEVSPVSSSGIRGWVKEKLGNIYTVIPDTAWLVSPYVEPTLADPTLLDSINVRLRGNVFEVEVYEVRQEAKKNEQAADKPTYLLEPSVFTYTQPVWKEVSTIVLSQMSDVVRDTVKVKVAAFEKTLPAIDGKPAVIARGDGRVGKRGELTKDTVVISRVSNGLQRLHTDLKETRMGLPAVREGQVNTEVVDTAARALMRLIARRFTITNRRIRARIEEVAGFAAREFDNKMAFYAKDTTLSRELIISTVQKEVLAKYYPQITAFLGLGDGTLEDLSRDPLMAAIAVADIFGLPEESTYLAPGESIRFKVASILRLTGASEETIAQWLASAERGSESVEASIRTADGRATEESNQLSVALLVNDFVTSLGQAYTNVGVTMPMKQTNQTLFDTFNEARTQAAEHLSADIDPARREVAIAQVAYWKTVWETHSVFVELQKQLEHPETVSIPRVRATGVNAWINRIMIDVHYAVAKVLLRTEVRITVMWRTLVQTSYEIKREGTEHKLADAGSGVVLALNHPVTRDIFGYTPKLLAFLHIGRNILEGIAGNPQAFSEVGKCFATKCWNHDIGSLVFDMAGLVPDEAGDIAMPNFDRVRDIAGNPVPELDEPQVTVGYAIRGLFQRLAFAFVTQ